MLTSVETGVPVRTTRAGTPHRMLVGLGLALLLVVGGTLPAAAARRADPGGECPPDQHDCSVWDDEPGTPGGPGGGGDNGGGDSGGGGGTPRCQWGGRTLPCYDDVLGWFDNSSGCYYKLEEPQPANTPEGKQWYLLTCNGGELGNQREELRDGPPPGYGAPPDPEELMRRALARITIKPPRVAVAPRRTTGPGLVGLPVWMWASAGQEYFGPVIRESETERGLTVTIDATFDRIVWNMGNGEHVPCPGAGTKYEVKGEYAGKPSPDCGYDSGYPKAGTYGVSATTHWTVTWRGGGQGDSFPLTRTSPTVQILINELQVVTR